MTIVSDPVLLALLLNPLFSQRQKLVQQKRRQPLRLQCSTQPVQLQPLQPKHTSYGSEYGLTCIFQGLAFVYRQPLGLPEESSKGCNGVEHLVDEAKLMAMLQLPKNLVQLFRRKTSITLEFTAKKAIPAGLGGWSPAGFAGNLRLLPQRLCQLPTQTRPSPSEQLQQIEHG